MQNIWTTTTIDERLRYAYWREALRNAFVPLEPVPLAGQADSFNGAINGHRLGSLKISTIAADGHEVRLTRKGISDQQGAPFFVNLLRRGSVQVTQYGEQSTAKAGDVYIVDSAAPWSVTFTEPFEMFCVEIEEDVLRPRLGARGRLSAPVLSEAHNKMLNNYLEMLSNQSTQELLALQDLIFDHCVTLLARTNAGTNSTPASVRDSQMTQQRLLSFINHNLTDTSLSPDMACEALRISRSYLFKLMAGTGHTFSGYVQRQRLEGCHSSLVNHPRRPISQIAESWGFTELSTFNRAYRKQYGKTPRQSRSDID
jgi:AraC-like DNA-binding protein